MENTGMRREVVKEVEYPDRMTWELAKRWGDRIPTFAEADPNAPEWRPTLVIPLDLSREGYGEIFVKNEADRRSNPTGTIKDRAAWELATLYRDFARALQMKVERGVLDRRSLESMPVPRLTVITAGNEGRALAVCFEKYGLPPPKIIVGEGTSQSIIDELGKLRADVYVVDLSRELSTGDILGLSDNVEGIDITSTRAIDPSSVFYDWHVHESFGVAPREVYLPFGSGRVMENYLTWQARTLRNALEGRADPRLAADVGDVISINVFGAEPIEYPSVADKLAAPFKPFRLFTDGDIGTFVNLSFTGRDTGIFGVSEGGIRRAYDIFLENGVEAEPSAAAGLALYMERFDQGLVPAGSRVLIINTGRGLQ